MFRFLASRWNLFSAVVLIAAAAWILTSAAISLAADDGRVEAPVTGFFAPDFTLTTLDGESIRLSDLRGRPVLINFWATWCPPCRAEMPSLQRAYEIYSEQGFVVLAVDALSQDDLQSVKDFVAEYELTFPILLDEDGQVFNRYRANSLPTSFFVAPDGVIKSVVVGGPMAPALLRVRIESLFTPTEQP